MKYKPHNAAALAQRFMEPGDAVLEIGAADGTYTGIYADRVGSLGAVVAVEPHTRSLRALRLAVETRPWVSVVPAAVGAAIGSARLYLDRRRPHRSSVYDGNVHPADHAVTGYDVPVITIDALVQTMRQSPSVIHIDAQGAEAAILRGAPLTLRLPIVWVIEVWPIGLRRAGASVDDVLGPFQALGYTPETTQGHTSSWPSVQTACQKASRTKSGHLDLVMRPAAVCVEACA